MKRIIQKILGFMLAILIIIGIMPVNAAAFDYSGWLWPVPSSNRMSRGYYSGHEAIDISPYEKNYSATEIYASKAGTVKVVYTGCKNFSNYGKQTCKSAGNCNPSDGYNSEGYCNNGFGNGVVINHGNGITSEYAHMTNRFFVQEGQQVQKGQLLGYMGSYGMSTGPHLHFSIKENGVGIINNPIGDNYFCSGSWNGIDTILYETIGYGGAEEPVVTVSWEQDVENDHWAIWWTDGVIGAKATVSGVSTAEIYQVGVKLYDSNLNLLAQKLESGDYSGKYNYVRMWYYINEELGYVLTPNTDYKCQFQIAVNETVYYSPYYDFRTQGPTQYTVTYDANGGWNAPASQTITQGENFTISGQYPIREGYEFMGWATSPSATEVEYWPNGVHYAEKDLYLYAVWKANTYTVKYDANGGSGAPATQKKTHGIDITLSETIPVRTGYKFLGWAGYQTATEPEYYPGGKYTYNSDVTMYAIWQVNIYTIIYNANGGTGSMDNQYINYDESAAIKTNEYTKTGYKFRGWNIRRVFDNKWLISEKGVGYGWGTKEDVANLNDNNGVTYYDIMLFAPEKSVTINGFWTTDNDNVKQYEFYAVWQKNISTYTVTYNANGGTGAPSAQTKTEGETLILSTAKPVRDGYEFLGWATSSTATTAQYQPGDSYTKDENVTLYAVWKQKEVVPENAPTIVIGEVSGKPGETVEVPVVLKNNPGFASIDLKLDFDSYVLELTEVRFEIFPSSNMASLASGKISGGDSKNITADGTMFTAVFKIKETANEGTSNINIVIYECCDINENFIDVSVFFGKVEVCSYILGDANGDGKVTSRDVTRILQYLVDELGDKTIDKKAADYNCDGKITSRDVTAILKYLVN